MIADVLLHLADDLRAVIQLGVRAFMVEGHRLALMQQRQRGKASCWLSLIFKMSFTGRPTAQ